MTRVIVITSGKGGVGKTNISVNIGTELARRGQRTCLLDADLGLANVDILLGISPDKNIDDFVFADSALSDIIVHTRWGLDIIPGANGIERMADLTPDELQRFQQGMGALSAYDYLLIDTSSGISRSVISFCLAAPEILLVLTGESTSLTDAYGLLKVLSGHSFRGKIRILVNKCASLAQARNTYIHFKTVCDKRLGLDISPAGAMLSDARIEEAVAEQQPFISLFPESVGSQCLRAIVGNIQKQDVAGQVGPDLSDFWGDFVDFLVTEKSLPAEAAAPALEKAAAPTTDKNGGDDVPAAEDAGSQENPTGPVPGAGEPDDSAAVVPPDVYSIHPSPVILNSAAALLLQGGAGVEELYGIIGADPILTARLLQLYRITSPRPWPRGAGIRALADALGVPLLQRFLAIAAQHAVRDRDFPAATEAADILIRPSLHCALLGRELARHSGYPFPEEAFLAGLFHAAGWLGRGGEKQHRRGRIPASLAEKEVIAADCRQAGAISPAHEAAQFARTVGCSPILAGAIECQDEPLAAVATGFELTRILWAAVRLCHAAETEVAEAIAACSSLLTLELSHLRAIMLGIDRELEKFAQRHTIDFSRNKDADTGGLVTAQLKERVLDLALLQSAFPDRFKGSRQGNPLCLVFQNLFLLFGIRNAVYLRLDSARKSLQAVGYPGCFGESFLAGVCFATDARHSLVAKAYNSGQVSITLAAELFSLGDRQLAARLDAENIIFLPIAVEDHPIGVSGVLVLGRRGRADDWGVDILLRLKRFVSFVGDALLGA